MRKFFIILSVISLCAGCSHKDQAVYENDTEPKEWGQVNTIKERPNAHSGKSVCVIDSINPYSLTFGKKIRDIGSGKYRNVTISYWVLMAKPNTKATTVFNITSEGKNVLWLGGAVEKKVNELNKWVNISETFSMPEVVDPNNDLLLYVWNNSKEEILIDDFRIELN